MKLNRNALSPEASVYLNIVRLFACELVVVSHYITSYRPTGLDSFFLGGLLGGVGAFMFFAISGFLIAYSLLQKTQNKQYGFRNYFVDRFSRIYSGLLPALLFSAVIAAAIYFTNTPYFQHLCEVESTPTPQNFVATVGMVDAFPKGFLNVTSSALGLASPLPTVAPFGFNGVLWTLMVEWWIYMFFGWLILGGIGFFGKRQMTVCFKVLFAVLAAVLSVILVGLGWDYSAFIIVWFIGVLVMCGISNSAVMSKLSGHVVAPLLGVFFAAALAGTIYEGYYIFTVTHESFSLVLGLLVSACVFLGVLLFSGRNIRWLSSVILHRGVVRYSATMAGFSYTLFLIHYPLILFLNGLNYTADRLWLIVPILLLINEVAFLLAAVTEKKHKQIAAKIKAALHISQ